MSNRNYISEIKEIKSRLENKSWESFKFELSDIECALDENRVAHFDFLYEEFYRYVPIRLISCCESFFRLVAKNLIDIGDEYKSNCKNFRNSNIKFSFDTVLAIESRTLTVGDFISHLIPFNNFDEINSNISTILGKDFLKELKQFTPTATKEYKKKIYERWKNDYDKIIFNVKNTFELRHIFCHEFGANIELSKEEALELFNDCQIFLEVSDNYFDSIINKDLPKNPDEWNTFLTEETASLDSIIEMYRTEFDPNIYASDKLEEAIKNWKMFRDNFVQYNLSDMKEFEEMYKIAYSATSAGMTKFISEFLINNFEKKKNNR